MGVRETDTDQLKQGTVPRKKKLLLKGVSTLPLELFKDFRC